VNGGQNPRKDGAKGKLVSLSGARTSAAAPGFEGCKEKTNFYVCEDVPR
jgi:hypothetical protein